MDGVRLELRDKSPKSMGQLRYESTLKACSVGRERLDIKRAARKNEVMDRLEVVYFRSLVALLLEVDDVRWGNGLGVSFICSVQNLVSF